MSSSLVLALKFITMSTRTMRMRTIAADDLSPGSAAPTLGRSMPRT